MKLGVVGLPNVGKSSLFNAITRAGAASENYPFCTIEPLSLIHISDIAILQRHTAALTDQLPWRT